MSGSRERGGFQKSPRMLPWLFSLVALVLPMMVPGGCLAAEPLAPSKEYRIGPEDVLNISVWGEDNLHRKVLVLPDGHISFPLAGELMAAGKSVPELRLELTDRLRRFVHDAQVLVSVEQIAGLRIYVIGEVQKPGQYMTGRYVDVLQALALAGGLTPYASKDDIRVLRHEGNKDAAYPFDYGEIKNGKRLEQNITLRSGDVVLVP